jgi:hypothetical protein
MISAPMWFFITGMVYGIFSAINGSTKPMPLLGNYFQNGFLASVN